MHARFFKISFVFFFFFGVLFFAGAQTSYAQELTYKFIESLPFIGPSLTSSGSGSLIVQYLGNVYTIILSVAALLAFFMLVVGGVQYTYVALSPSAKGEAKTRMLNALLGLLIVLGAYVILNTINPDLVRGDLFIEPITSTPGAIGGVGGNVTTAPLLPGAVAGTPGFGTSNNCPTCAPLDPNIPAKNVGAGCRTGSSQCTIDPQVGGKLSTLNTSLDSAGITWEVTEMYPPTRTHRNACHQNGTCVDAACRNCSNQQIAQMARAAQTAGLRPVFEVTSDARRNELINAGIPASDVINLGSWISGEHFSLYNN